jgi:hypothetical protein
MLLQSLRVLCKAPGGAGSIWKYLKVLMRATRVSRRFGFGFRTELHFTDIVLIFNVLTPMIKTFKSDSVSAFLWGESFPSNLH